MSARCGRARQPATFLIELESTMDRVWLAQYPAGIPPEVDVHKYASLRDILEESCRRFAERPAYGNFGASITYAELDRASRNFGAYLQKVVGLKKADRVAL